MLRKGGNLTFITSNKWMRAGYGEGLRTFLSSKVNTEAVLDFGMAQNFGAATTYTCITRYVKEKPDGKVMSCYATDEGHKDPRAPSLKAGAKDWKLLLQLDTDDDIGWMWGDVGTLYFWVREQDAQAGDFSRVWMVFQCC